MAPSTTENDSGMTLARQPVRSLPLKSDCHSSAANPAAHRVIDNRKRKLRRIGEKVRTDWAVRATLLFFRGVINKLDLFAGWQPSPAKWRHRRQLHSVDFIHAQEECFAKSVHSIENDSRG